MTPPTPCPRDAGPPLFVFSHPRSGTHYLGCALALNFRLDVTPVAIDQDYFLKDPPRFLTPDGEADHVPWGSLVAHEAVHRFREHVDARFTPRVYIYRDCFSVVRSLYSWRFQRNHKDQPLLADEELSFPEFLRRPLGWQESVHVAAERPLTPVEHWAWHVSGWRDGGDCCVSFAELRADYAGVLGRIGERFGLERRDPGAFLPVPAKVGYVPAPVRAPTPAEDAEARAVVADTLRALATVYPAAAEAVGEAAPEPTWARHVVTRGRFDRETRELVAALEEERRRAARREQELTAQNATLLRDRRAVEGLLERRHAAFRDFVTRIHDLAEG